MSAAFQEGLGEFAAVARKTIPYEYPFHFALSGVRDSQKSSKITISVEAPFVAVSIGYGVVPRAATVTFGVPERPPAGPGLILAVLPSAGNSLLETNFAQLILSLADSVDETDQLLNGTIGPATAAVLTNGFRLNPSLAGRLLLNSGSTDLGATELATMFTSIGAPASEVRFLYTLRDEGTGREFQSGPILNTAGLGSADGDRPFRYFATPITFAPRSVIRMEITELSTFQGDLQVVLHGYKMLGETGTPTSQKRTIGRQTRRLRRR